MRAAADAVGPVVIVGWRLERLRRPVPSRMRGYRGLGVWRAAKIRQRRRGSCRRRPWAAVGKVASYMRGDRAIAHVVIARPMEIQRRKLARRRDCRVLRRRRRRLNGDMVREKAVAWAPRSVFVVPQIGFCLRGGLFNGPGMVVLMARQGGPASKGLLAIGIRALVGSLAGMDSAMTGQGRGVTKSLAGSDASCCYLSGYIPCHIFRTYAVSRQYGRGNAQSTQTAG